MGRGSLLYYSSCLSITEISMTNSFVIRKMRKMKKKKIKARKKKEKKQFRRK